MKRMRRGRDGWPNVPLSLRWTAMPRATRMNILLYLAAGLSTAALAGEIALGPNRDATEVAIGALPPPRNRSSSVVGSGISPTEPFVPQAPAAPLDALRAVPPRSSDGDGRTAGKPAVRERDRERFEPVVARRQVGEAEPLGDIDEPRVDSPSETGGGSNGGNDRDDEPETTSTTRRTTTTTRDTTTTTRDTTTTTRDTTTTTRRETTTTRDTTTTTRPETTTTRDTTPTTRDTTTTTRDTTTTTRRETTTTSPPTTSRPTTTSTTTTTTTTTTTPEEITTDRATITTGRPPRGGVRWGG